MITIHHLGQSQSERILWLCEELGLPYALKRYQRDPVTRLAPPELKALHPMQAAPLIEDGELLLAESGAIVEYLIARHGGGRLALPADHPRFADYLYWFHFSNANLQATLGRSMTVGRLDLPADDPVRTGAESRLQRALAFVDARLATVEFLAGEDFTAADIMVMFSLSTMGAFHAFDLQPYPAIRAYLRRLAERPAYRRAMAQGDPGMAPMIG
ncbi:glutathione S-transferase [Xylophilus sp. Kf1]|nr:glutathione S-transferase [Xylophilus sp. Kf1]